MIWAGSRFLALQPHSTTRPAFTHADVVYYTPSEYLPPLDTRRSTSAHARKADPEYSGRSHHFRSSRGGQPLANYRRLPPNIQLAARRRVAQRRLFVGKNAQQLADADRARSRRSRI